MAVARRGVMGMLKSRSSHGSKAKIKRMKLGHRHEAVNSTNQETAFFPIRASPYALARIHLF
jgi:hypothetical protein